MTEKPTQADEPPAPATSTEPGQLSDTGRKRVSRRSLLVGAAGGAFAGWTAGKNITRSVDEVAIAESLLPLNLAMQTAMETGETVPINYLTKHGNFEFTIRYAGKAQAPGEDGKHITPRSGGREIV